MEPLDFKQIGQHSHPTPVPREERDEFYSRHSVHELIENDELSGGEEGFMLGYLDA